MNRRLGAAGRPGGADVGGGHRGLQARPACELGAQQRRHCHRPGVVTAPPGSGPVAYTVHAASDDRSATAVRFARGELLAHTPEVNS
jgi:hypothetical protein